MRIVKIESGENLTGKIAVCSTGRVAIITGTKELTINRTGEKIPVYCGIGFDGKGTWASTQPCVVAEDAEEFRAKLEKRFGGKMSFLG